MTDDMKKLAEAAKDCARTIAKELAELGVQLSDGTVCCIASEVNKTLLALIRERDEARERIAEQEREYQRERIVQVREINARLAAEAALSASQEDVKRLTAEIEARRDGGTADTIIANWFDLGRELKVPADGSIFEAVMRLKAPKETPHAE